jgi:hypothetical protein
MLRYAQNTENALSMSRCFIKPFISSVLAIGSAYASYAWLKAAILSELSAFLVAIPIAVLIYFIFVLILGVLDRDDIKMIPVLKNIVKEK